jgi:hypothetical protein
MGLKIREGREMGYQIRKRKEEGGLIIRSNPIKRR